jgi:hypothetical protein
MAVKKTYTPVNESDASAALMEQKKLREDEGAKLDAKRAETEEKASKEETK